MGIAGAGNSGTVIAALVGPRLAELVGWQAVMGLALLPVLLTFVTFFALAKDSPHSAPPPPLAEYVRSLRRRETAWLSLFYSMTFGGLVGLSSYLGIFFRDEYGVSKVLAGDLTAGCVFAGSLLRPVGGALADRVGGVRMLTVVLGIVALLLGAVATLPPLWLVIPILVVTMGVLGVGNGAVFQMIPQIFQREIGVVTGLVGAAGGVGGFYLPTLLGALQGQTNSFGPGFAAIAATALGVLLLLVMVRGQLHDAIAERMRRAIATREAAIAPVGTDG
jgi:NNP family nitrate/nitrite transporter-like MFS transporter